MTEENVRSLKKGTVIFQCKPFVYGLSSKYRTTRCDNCMKSGKLSKCSGCQYVFYCDRNCQKESWSIHKFECANFKRVSPLVVPDAARLMARIIIKLTQGGQDEKGYYTDTNYKKFKDLMSHYSDIKNDKERMEHFISLCGVLLEFFNPIPISNSAELIGIYGRMSINSFNILDLDMHSIGLGIYLGPSIIDHSCKPNATCIFEGTTIIIRTIEDLPCLDWKQIRISYIDVLKTTKDRRAELLNSYYFLCDCKRCTQPEPFAEAAACPNSSCTHPCSPEDDVCAKCNTEISKEFKEKFQEITDLTQYHLQDMKNISYLDVSRMCLRKQRGVLHKLNIQYVSTLESAGDAAVNLGFWEEVEIYGEELLSGYLFYYGKIHPLTGLLYLTIGKVQLYLGKIAQALNLLKEACEILKITHGENSVEFREVLRPLLEQALYERLAEHKIRIPMKQHVS